MEEAIEHEEATQSAETTRWLTPENTRIHKPDVVMIHCELDGKDIRGIYAVLMFPVRHPRGYISVRCFNEAGKEREIGVIKRLADFPEDQQQLILDNLNKHYYEQVIQRVHHVENEYGLLFFDVETQRGREQFVMPWRADCAQSYGEQGKVLIESLGNRYIVPNIEDLPPADQRRFRRVIYW